MSVSINQAHLDRDVNRLLKEEIIQRRSCCLSISDYAEIIEEQREKLKSHTMLTLDVMMVEFNSGNKEIKGIY